MLLCRPLRQVVNSSGGRVENATRRPEPDASRTTTSASSTKTPRTDTAMCGSVWRVPWAATKRGSERRARHDRHTTRRRHSVLAGRRSRISGHGGGCTAMSWAPQCQHCRHITHADRSDIVDGWPAGVYQGARARRRRPTVTTDRPSRAAWRGLIDGVVSAR